MKENIYLNSPRECLAVKKEKNGSLSVVMYVYKLSLSNNRNSNAGEQ